MATAGEDLAAPSWPRPRQPITAAPPAQLTVAAAGVLLAAALAAAVRHAGGGRLALAYGLGVALGVVLFHTRFGFASAWRQLVVVGQGRALRAHMLMLAVGCALFAPLLAAGAGLGVRPTPLTQPVGVALVVGAALFGVGMQLGGSCASGTLFAVGSGQNAVLLTLGGFVAGSTLGAATAGVWAHAPASAPVWLPASRLGYPGALAVSLLAMAVVTAVSLLVERRRRPPAMAEPPRAGGWARLARGAWPLWVGAVGLGGLNAATLLVTGAPWGITSAFALWGSRLLGALGVPTAHWAYWRVPHNAAALHAPLLADRVSVMDFGVVLGALIASAAAGAFSWRQPVPARTALAAVLGGVLMGYGARLSGGCNIGAYFSGVASFSLHGWIWAAAAILGVLAGTRLRPWFGLANPKPTDSAC